MASNTTSGATLTPASSLNIPADKRPIVIFGPSGVGKSTLLKKLFAEFPNHFGFSVSHTTRAPRPGEEDGVAYHFVTPSAFASLVEAGAFLEHASFGGNSYGTTIQAVADVSTEGVRGKSGDTRARRAILDIDAQGVRIIKAQHIETLSRPLFIFLSPPSFSALKQRLEGRGTEAPDSIRKRLGMAGNELAYARTPGAADVVIVNDDVERAYGLLRLACTGKLNQGGDQLPAEEKELEEEARLAVQVQ
ncbi:guanylate kinase [Tilletiaria anomala UBC 951]|uniref:Guanylate kinase n=1 Tax=Tilletiaria anomala (strain ATCC 24038 / CBS 436.72 / UBC 951) TaxID=1037660 RepID=A0A066VMT9_TILAU|nr:guanylate kinase [Tilletiaria anomala UBC 951]KDN40094.1 guanylate kinase [Tilletiaria anomala UBC 951]